MNKGKTDDPQESDMFGEKQENLHVSKKWGYVPILAVSSLLNSKEKLKSNYIVGNKGCII